MPGASAHATGTRPPGGPRRRPPVTEVVETSATADRARHAGLAGPARTRGGARRPLLPALIFAIVVTQIPFVVTLYLSDAELVALRRANAGSSGSATTAPVLTDSRLRAALVTP